MILKLIVQKYYLRELIKNRKMVDKIRLFFLYNICKIILINLSLFTYMILFVIFKRSCCRKKGWKAMQNEKHLEASVIIYFGLLLILVIVNLCNHVDIIDMGYLLVVLCCALKFLMIIKSEQK